MMRRLATDLTKTLIDHTNLRVTSIASYKLTFRGYCGQSTSEASALYSFDDVAKIVRQPRPNTILVDVREPQELKETGHIPTAINIPVNSIEEAFSLPENEFKKRFKENKPSKDTEIVFYCKLGKRSTQAFNTAVKLGFTKSKNYVGSWQEWVSKQG